LTTLAKAKAKTNETFIVQASLTVVTYDCKNMFIVQATGGFDVKLFTSVIYHHSMVILSFCVIKQHYERDYHGLAVNYNGICVTNVIKHDFT
jgi:hypothetical protein